MPRYHRILAATDYGACSTWALETAASLAARSRAELAVLHVVEERARPYPFPAPQAFLEVAEANLARSVERLRVPGLEVSRVLREGIAWSEICAAAADFSADLVVVGTQGRRGLPRAIVGSVAEQVVRMAPCPVLTVHLPEHGSTTAASASQFRHIVAPTNFSEAAGLGVGAAVDLAVELHAALTLVYVHEPATYYYFAFDDVAAAVDERIGRRLEAEVARVRSRVPSARGEVRRAVPWHGIVDVAREREADLVVMSTLGRHGPSHLLVGSVAERTVRLSPVPVLTIGTHVAGVRSGVASALA